MAKNEGVAELKYETKEIKISVNLLGSGKHVAVQPVQAIQSAGNSTTKESVGNLSEGFHAITSPFVGTFYRASSPNEPDFVKVGDRVSKGQTLCILEAMKIMNEIESEVSGKIVKVLVDDSSPVEFDQPLFLVDPS